MRFVLPVGRFKVGVIKAVPDDVGEWLVIEGAAEHYSGFDSGVGGRNAWSEAQRTGRRVGSP